MNRKNGWLILGTLLLAGAAGASVQEEGRLSKAQAAIDNHAAIWSADAHAKALETQFKIPAATITALSAKNQGWGAVNIEVALATEITRLHADKFPVVASALDEVERQRAAGSTWGDIAKKQEVGLAPVVKSARETAKKLTAQDLAAKHKKSEAAKVTESQGLIKDEHRILAGDDKKTK